MLRAGLVLALGALVMTQGALGVGDFVGTARPAFAAPRLAACEKLTPEPAGPDQITFRLLEQHAPLPSRLTLPFVFDEVCRIIEIPRLPVRVDLAGSHDGTGDFSVDDRLDIDIKPTPLNACTGRTGCLSWNFAEGRDPITEGTGIHVLKPQDLRKLFPTAGTYEVTVRVVDLYPPLQANSHIDLFVQLAPVLPPPPPPPDGAWAVVLLFLVLGGSVVGILMRRSSRDSSLDVEDGS